MNGIPTEVLNEKTDFKIKYSGEERYGLLLLRYRKHLLLLLPFLLLLASVAYVCSLLRHFFAAVILLSIAVDSMCLIADVF